MPDNRLRSQIKELCVKAFRDTEYAKQEASAAKVNGSTLKAEMHLLEAAIHEKYLNDFIEIGALLDIEDAVRQKYHGPVHDLGNQLDEARGEDL